MKTRPETLVTKLWWIKKLDSDVMTINYDVMDITENEAFEVGFQQNMIGTIHLVCEENMGKNWHF